MKLADRLENAKTVESKEAAALRYESLRPMVLNKYGFLQPTTQRVEGAFGKGTRKQARAMAKLVADNRHMVGVAFQSRRPRKLGVGPEVCCESHGCSYTYGVATDEGPGMDRTVYFRTWFHTLSEAKRREFLYRRTRYAPAADGKPPQRVWLLEAPPEMQKYVRSSTYPDIEVANTDLVPVCTDFLCYALGISKNKLFQPTVESPVFQTSMPSASISRSSEKPGKAFYIVKWIINLSQFYLHDPTKQDQIILPFADKRAVYDMYLHEADEPAVRDEYMPLGPASRDYFYATWKADEGCAHVKTRRTFRFSLCPECVEFINTRKHVLDDAERAKVQKAEGMHHAFVRKERGSYYCRRHEAKSFPDTCFSIIIDGADQSAFGTPHFYTHSKGYTPPTHPTIPTPVHTTTPPQTTMGTGRYLRISWVLSCMARPATASPFC
jgi:hypothetical protein